MTITDWIKITITFNSIVVVVVVVVVVVAATSVLGNLEICFIEGWPEFNDNDNHNDDAAVTEENQN
jgi:hypothetical protein